MNESDDNDWSNYETGPFCRHWSTPGDCDIECAACGHRCTKHSAEGDDTSCMEDDCQCPAWVEEADDNG